MAPASGSERTGDDKEGRSSPRARLSALIIAKDEERDLPGCIQSLRGAVGELVVLVDEASGDRTEQLARSAGARVARRRFDDFASQRQAALALCTGEWVLWIDADERLTAELRERLPRLLDADAAGWSLRFSVRFLGRTMRWGGLGGERHLRLFRRAKAKFIGGALHEGVEVDGAVRKDDGPGLLHEPYRDLADYRQKLELYTTLAAEKRLAAGRRARPWDRLRLPAEFLWRAFFRLGFLDGYPGLAWAGLSAYHSWLKYAKLREMERARR